MHVMSVHSVPTFGRIILLFALFLRIAIQHELQNKGDEDEEAEESIHIF